MIQQYLMVSFLLFSFICLGQINHKSSNELVDPAIKSGFILEKMTVYPNPLKRSQILRLRFHNKINAIARLYDLTGNLVKEDLIEYSGTHMLNVQGIKPGIYLLNVVSGYHNATRKIVVSQ